MFLRNAGLIIFLIFMGGPLLGSILGEICLKKSAFLVSKLGIGRLLEHGPLIEILRYAESQLTFAIPKLMKKEWATYPIVQKNGL